MIDVMAMACRLRKLKFINFSQMAICGMKSSSRLKMVSGNQEPMNATTIRMWTYVTRSFRTDA